jgi:RNA 2',3'-cyclic 3'-phosphodiesterase
MEPGTVVRLFIALNPPPSVIACLTEIQQRLRDELSRSFSESLRIRWVRPAQFHLTLVFLGNVYLQQIDSVRAEIAALMKQVARLPSLTLHGLGCFPTVKDPRILWVGLGRDETLEALQELFVSGFAAKLGLDRRDRSYPHLTIGRIRSRGGVADLDRALSGLATQVIGTCPVWEVHSVALMQSLQTSEGPLYTCLAEFFIETSPRGSD